MVNLAPMKICTKNMVSPLRKFMNPFALTICNLHKNFHSLEVLKGINLNIKSGMFFGLLGPNGAGKSTTINILAGLTLKSKGDVKIFGYDIEKDYKTVRQFIGLSQQEFNLDRFFTLHDLLLYQGGLYGLRQTEVKKRVEELLQRFGLWEHRHQKPHRLSGGLKRRAMIVKALIHDPKILILDEPTAGVDVELRHDLWNYLKKLNREGKTIILTTHYLEEAKTLCDEIAILLEGKILIHDSIEKVIEHSKGDLINYFIEEDQEQVHA